MAMAAGTHAHRGRRRANADAIIEAKPVNASSAAWVMISLAERGLGPSRSMSARSRRSACSASLA